MEVRSYLDFVGRARGLSGAKLKERTELVLDECGLRPMYRKVIRELSKGYKQRTGLAQALIHDPDIIVLDEPTSGLDPHQIVEIRQLIRKLASETTVILSTHILQEVEATADRIVIINRGQIVGEGTFEELRSRAKQNERMLVSVQGARAEVERLLSGLEGAQKVQFVSDDEGFVTFIVKSRIGVALYREVGRLAQAKNWVLRELSDKPLTLEETFLTLTEPKKRSAAQDYSVSKGESAA
jgi:ABC-2 type transport system ATP-binding protein